MPRSTLLIACILMFCHDVWSQSNLRDDCWVPPLGGLYFGINGGFANHSLDDTDMNSFLGSTKTYSASTSSWEVGAQIGYDWACSHTLFGFIYDWNWINARSSLTLASPISVMNGNEKIEGTMHWFSTLRARGGLVIHDLLFYLSAGAAVSDLKSQLSREFETPRYFKYHRQRWAWTIGFGTEWAYYKRWSLCAEILYMRFKAQHATLITPERTFRFILCDDAWVGRICLNYRFSLCSLWTRKSCDKIRICN